MPSPPAALRRGPSLARALCRGCLAGLALALVLHAGYILGGPNFYTVLPGAIYRSCQPNDHRLDVLVHRHGIRTVLNLCGCCDPKPEYLEEARASNRLNISQEDLGLSAGRLPPVYAIRHLVEILDHTEYPILVHCHKGIDRTGLVSAIALLLHTDTPLAEARRQLSPWHAHLPFSRTGHMDQFFDLYEEWLTTHGQTHSRAVFRRWLTHDYCPAECLCRIEVLDPPGPGPIHAPYGRPSPVRIRCHNTSVRPWRFRPASGAGIHANYKVFSEPGRLVYEASAGCFHATIPAGGHIDLTIALPALRRLGRYELRLDMADEQHGYFLQMGSEPLVREVVVP